MPKPILYLFAISHYCEKARWALDHFGIAYQSRFVMPGMNRAIAKKLGGSRGSLPFMRVDGMIVEGSAAVVDWGEANRLPDRASLAGDDLAAVRAVEQRLDDILGVHVRRYYYSDALLSDPVSVRRVFARDLPLLQRLAVTFGWSKIVPRMVRLMDLGPSQGAESYEIVVKELEWLDGLLAGGRQFLVGNRLSRADITAASLLAPFILPPQHPTYSSLKLPTAIAATAAEWRNRPVLKWVNRLYADYR